MDSIVKTIRLLTMECCECGIPFAIPESLQEKYEREGGFWSCPNGHRQHYCETKEMKLTHKLDQAEAEIEELRLSIKRAQRGVCPYCKRHFVNVERHMKCKHKDKIK